MADIERLEDQVPRRPHSVGREHPEDRSPSGQTLENLPAQMCWPVDSMADAGNPLPAKSKELQGNGIILSFGRITHHSLLSCRHVLITEMVNDA